MRALPTLVVALAFAQGAAAEELRTFKDWVVGCDNLKSCIALGLPPSDGEATGSYVKVIRSGEAEAEPSVEFVSGAASPVPDGKLALASDIPNLVGIPNEALSAAIDGDFLRARLSGTTARDFLGALNRAKSLRITIIGRDGQPVKDMEPGIVSLEGASATLLHMDDVQKRVGTVTALHSPGSNAAATIPPPPAEPTVTGAKMREMTDPLPPEPAALKKKRAEGECNDGFEPIVFALSESLRLWGLCNSAGAYNVFYDLFLVEGEKERPPAFEIPGWLDKSASDFINPDLSDDGLAISSNYLGRGLGDCGTSASWAWDGEKFHLVRYAAMEPCLGVLPDDWPVLYRARVQ